jgi:cyanophycin synthetase
VHHGVSEDAITMIADEVTAVDAALEMAQDGDLLVIFGDNSARCWKQVVHFREDEGDETAAKPTQTQSKPVIIGDFESEGETLIRDERGVRLARNTDEDGD